MNLCSVIVHARPEKITQVENTLTALPGVEVHGGASENLESVKLSARPRFVSPGRVTENSNPYCYTQNG